VLRRKDGICRFVAYIARIALCPFYRIQVEGEDRLPSTKAFVLLPKHQRWQDIPLIALAAPRPLYYIAKYELFTNRWIGGFLESLGGIPLNREQPMRSRTSIRAITTFLNRGDGVVLFPEGTYYEDRMGPGKSGMLRVLVSRMSFPLIPAGVRYQKGRFRTVVRIAFGHAIHPAKTLSPDRVLSQVMEAIALLSDLEKV